MALIGDPEARRAQPLQLESRGQRLIEALDVALLRRAAIVGLSSATSALLPGPPFESIGGSLGTTTTTYGASKAALERFTVGLAAELWGTGVAVNTVAPLAIVRTPGADALVGEYADRHPELVESLEQLVEAVVALCECDPQTLTGGVHVSGALLERLGRTVMTLDGATPFTGER